MYKRILVPIDGSETSMFGLREAIELAKGQPTKLKIIHIVEDWTPIGGMSGETLYTPEVIDKLRGFGEDILQKAKALTEQSGVSCECEMLEKAGVLPSGIIVDQAIAWNADLIVIGTHGRRGLKRMVMGSDAEEVVRNAPVPILLIRAKPGAK